MYVVSIEDTVYRHSFWGEHNFGLTEVGNLHSDDSVSAWL